MIARLIAAWKRIPEPVKKWLKGAEVAVSTAVVAAFIGAPATDFKSKASIGRLLAGVAAAGYGALRLYMTQSPLQNVIVQEKRTESLTADGVTATATKQTTITK